MRPAPQRELARNCARGRQPQRLGLHERHEPVREARHRAGRCRCRRRWGSRRCPPVQPRIGTLHLTTGPLHPSLTRHPRLSAGVRRELPLLGEPGPPAALLHGAPEQPRRSALLVELEHRLHPGEVQRQVQQRLGDVVGLHRAAGQVDDRQPEARAPTRTEVVAQPHRAGRVAAHRRDPAVGGAGAERQHGRARGREPVDPGVGRDRLAGLAGRRRAPPSGPRR